MKKVLTLFLVIILIGGAGIGGYFIGKNVQQEEPSPTVPTVTQVTKESIVEILDDFSYSAGWAENIDTSSVKDTSNKQSYDNNVMDYDGYDDLIKSYISFTKYALLNSNVKEKEFYSSTATYTMSERLYTGEMGLYYEFGENCAFINIHDFSSDITITLIVDIKPVQENTYVMNILTNKSMLNKSYLDGFTIQQLYMDQYANQIYNYSLLAVNTLKTNLKEITINDVDDMQLFACDIKSNQLINISKEEIITEETYNFDALINVYTSQVSRYSGVTFGNRDYSEIDALEKVYEDLGYQVI